MAEQWMTSHNMSKSLLAGKSDGVFERQFAFERKAVPICQQKHQSENRCENVRQDIRND